MVVLFDDGSVVPEFFEEGGCFVFVDTMSCHRVDNRWFGGGVEGVDGVFEEFGFREFLGVL